MDRIIGKSKTLDIMGAVKILHFQDKIMCELFIDTTLGKRYESYSLNFWSNEYMRDVKGKLLDVNIEFDTNLENEKLRLDNCDHLF